MSRQAVFGALFAVCLLGISFLYFADISVMTSRFVTFTYSHLEHVALIWPSNNNNITDEKTAINVNDSTSTFYYIKNTTRLPLITLASDSSKNFTPEVLSTTTTMSFNTTLVVACKKSPYIQCVPPNVKPLPDKVFKVVYVRRPGWISTVGYKLTSCQVKQCSMSDGPVTNDTDVVIVYGLGLSDNFQPPQRWPNQTYILSGWESPVHTGSDFLHRYDNFNLSDDLRSYYGEPESLESSLKPSEGVGVMTGQTACEIIHEDTNSPWNTRINLIMSYRVDSDVFVPYFSLKFSPKPLKERPNYYEIAKNKTGTAVWLVSNCRTQSRREQYVTEMQKYIDVDILGVCGRPCSRSNSDCKNWATKYKFYLAFENSLCTDYVTEKFFKIFHNNIPVVPVVRGGADYDKYFPNFTYINSAHFKTPKDLALHLKHLAADLDTYSKYLEYKDLYVQNLLVGQFCRLCSFLHTHKLPDTKTYNLKAWMNDGHCHDAKDL